MVREIVNIDEEICNGCGVCVPACHEGALQIIDGKARLVSDLMCDGLGACIGECPEGAITIEEREAEPYDEIKVMGIMVDKGLNTVVAHLKHLKEHNENEFFAQAVNFIKASEADLTFDFEDVRKEMHAPVKQHAHAGGCPGSAAKSFNPAGMKPLANGNEDTPSALSQWPVQMHLINPAASYFEGSDLLLAADCVAFSMGNFHQKYLSGKKLAIACPKLDSSQEIYLQKLTALIDQANINTLTVMIMEVPCCGGLLRLAQMASEQASRKVPVKALVVSIQGEILNENWI